MSAVLDWWADATLMDWTLRLYHVAAIGQTLFVALWLSLPWWTTRVGRALMVKSFALMLVLDWGLIGYYFGPFRHQEGIGVALFALVAVGILTQLTVIAYEAWHGRRETVSDLKD